MFYDDIFGLAENTVQCPYCNVKLSIPYGQPAPQKAWCPNCWKEITLNPPTEFKALKYDKEGKVITEPVEEK